MSNAPGKYASDAARLKFELDYLTDQRNKIKAKARTKAGKRDPGKVDEVARIVAETQAAFDAAAAADQYDPGPHVAAAAGAATAAASSNA
jgi:hypothetical protein